MRRLNIVNDTELDIVYDVYINNKKQMHRTCNRGASYKLELQNEAVNMRLIKENIWNSKSFVSAFLLMLYSMDWSCILFESNNLPYSIDYQIPMMDGESVTEDIHLSTIIKVEDKWLNQWSKYSIMQCIWIVLLIVIVGVLLSFIFQGWIKLLFLSGILFFSSIIFCIVNKRRKALLNILKTLF